MSYVFMVWILKSQAHRGTILAQSDTPLNCFYNLLQQKIPQNPSGKANVFKIEYFPEAYPFQKPSDKALMTSWWNLACFPNILLREPRSPGPLALWEQFFAERGRQETQGLTFQVSSRFESDGLKYLQIIFFSLFGRLLMFIQKWN